MAESKGLHTPMQSNEKLFPEDNDEQSLSPTLANYYQSIVGKLMFAMIATRPDLALTVSTLGRFGSQPSANHLKAAKRTLRYLRQTATHGITCNGASGIH